MAAVNSRQGKLFVDFRYRGIRCREQTQLIDTPVNRKRLGGLIKTIEAEITLGIFDYQKYFPKSKSVVKFKEIEQRETNAVQALKAPNSPRLAEFADIWLKEKKIEWSKGHYDDVDGILTKYLIPMFGNQKISAITKQQILQFRSILTKVPGQKEGCLGPSRINHIMTPLRMLINEAADRYEFTSAWKNIKALKIGRSEIDPFSLSEIEQLIECAPEEYKAYYITRFFTGIRTCEIDGLMWDNVDFKNKIILVRQSLVKGVLKGLKTDSSYREIDLIDRVAAALKKHKETADLSDKFVFTNHHHKHLNYTIVSRTIWYRHWIKLTCVIVILIRRVIPMQPCCWLLESHLNGSLSKWGIRQQQCYFVFIHDLYLTLLVEMAVHLKNF